MSNTLGPLPKAQKIHDDRCSETLEYWTEDDIEEERLRCYELGIAQERERIKAKLLERNSQSAHYHNYYVCMAVELFGPLG